MSPETFRDFRILCFDAVSVLVRPPGKTMMMMTQGEIEAAVCEGISRFELDYMGRGPKDICSYRFGDLLVVRLHGVLTAAEAWLVMAS